MEAEQSAQPTGTNRSNPPDPNAFPAPAGESRKTAGVQRQAPITGRARRRPPDTSPPPSQIPPGHPSQGIIKGLNHQGRNRRGRNAPRAATYGAKPARRGGNARAQAQGGLASLVATARGQTPDPIPNSAVKTLSADGTAAQAAEEQVAARLAKPPTPRTRSAGPPTRRGTPRPGPATAAAPNTPPNTPSPRGGAAR